MNQQFTEIADIYLTTRCDMNCVFCYANKSEGNLSLQQFNDIADLLWKNGSRIIGITGGEPLLHEDVVKACSYAKAVGFQTILYTNGNKLTKDMLALLAPNIDWFALSLDGFEEVNKIIGRTSNHHETIFRVIEEINYNYPSCKVRLTTVVTKQNISDVEKIAQSLLEKRLRIGFWSIKQMLPTRKGKTIYNEFGFSEEEFNRNMTEILNQYGGHIPIRLRNLSDKSGDIMCVHVNGLCTTTIKENNDYRIISLGNILEDCENTLMKWNQYKSSVNSGGYYESWNSAI